MTARISLANPRLLNIANKPLPAKRPPQNQRGPLTLGRMEKGPVPARGLSVFDRPRPKFVSN
jgi:hypothetical protein